MHHLVMTPITESGMMIQMMMEEQVMEIVEDQMMGALEEEILVIHRHPLHRLQHQRKSRRVNVLSYIT
jgi:hypothetical protein